MEFKQIINADNVDPDKRMIFIKKLGRRLCSTGKNYAYYSLYLCPHCGKKVEKQSGYEKRYKSCGCLHDYFTGLGGIKHGDCKTTGRSGLYNSWDNMVRRCSNENRPEYKNYGGRGIKLYEEWRDYSTFKKWAMANGYKKGLVIDRIDNDGNYHPDNCRWVTRAESCRNQRNTRMTWKKVLEVRERYRKGETNQSALAREYKVSSAAISEIVHNYSWINPNNKNI